MALWITKLVVTAAVVVLASELVKVSGRLGAFVAAMPLVTLLVMGWMHVEGEASASIAEYGRLTFWYVLPTLPMFLLTPWLLDRGWGFGGALAAGVVLTVACLGGVALVARRFGVHLLGT